MRPRRTHFSNLVFTLDGGTEDNDLWTHVDVDEGGHPCIRSTWVPSDEERKAIAAGSNIELVVWGEGMPPVMVRPDDSPLGRPPMEGER